MNCVPTMDEPTLWCEGEKGLQKAYFLFYLINYFFFLQRLFSLNLVKEEPEMDSASTPPQIGEDLLSGFWGLEFGV